MFCSLSAQSSKPNRLACVSQCKKPEFDGLSIFPFCPDLLWASLVPWPPCTRHPWPWHVCLSCWRLWYWQSQLQTAWTMKLKEPELKLVLRSFEASR